MYIYGDVTGCTSQCTHHGANSYSGKPACSRWVSVYMYVHTCIRICIYIYEDASGCTSHTMAPILLLTRNLRVLGEYVYTYVYIYLYIYIYVYIYVYIFIHANHPPLPSFDLYIYIYKLPPTPFLWSNPTLCVWCRELSTDLEHEREALLQEVHAGESAREVLLGQLQVCWESNCAVYATTCDCA